MLAITLDENELTELKLLLRDIELIQKLNKPFDYSAINTLYYIIDSINKKEDYYSQTEISDEQIWQVGDMYANQNTINDDNDLAYFKGQLSGFFEGAKWYREQLKSRQ